MDFSLGLIEVSALGHAIMVLDTMEKAADVEFVATERKLGGRLVTLVVRGELSAVQASVDAGAEPASLPAADAGADDDALPPQAASADAARASARIMLRTFFIINLLFAAGFLSPPAGPCRPPGIQTSQI